MDISDLWPERIHDLILILTGWDCPVHYCLIISRAILWLIILISLMVAYRRFIRTPRKKKEDYIKKHIDSGYVEYLSKRSKHLYIPARFQSISPSHYPDIMESIRSAPTENMIKKYIDEIFVENNVDSPLYCVLGGSGMGKTSFLVNVIKAYVKRYGTNSLPFDIELINLSNEDYQEKIAAIEEPKTTILLLDALDENPKAVAEYESFIASLEQSIQSFRIVVITCRTQFFPDEEHELKQSKIRNNSRSKGFYGYTRHYISPFSDKEVEIYLRKRYGLNFKKRRLAKKIVNQCTSFAHRPLLLSYIDVLLSDKRKYGTVLDVYEALIEKWLERDTSRNEHPNETRNQLMSLLQRAAIEMYNNFPVAGFYLDSETISSLSAELEITSPGNILRGRSLLNRDARGDWKFAHKSFLEFFLAKECFENESFKLDFNGLDVALSLFQDYCRRELDKNLVAGNIKLVKSHNLSPTLDSLAVSAGASFNLRFLEPFDDIKTLEIESRKLEQVESSIPRTNIQYIKIGNYQQRYNLNCILKYHQIRYVSVFGQECSKSFIKEAVRQGVVVLSNGVLYGGDIIEGTTDAPMDIKSAYYVSRPSISVDFLFRRGK